MGEEATEGAGLPSAFRDVAVMLGVGLEGEGDGGRPIRER